MDDGLDIIRDVAKEKGMSDGDASGWFWLKTGYQTKIAWKPISTAPKDGRLLLLGGKGPKDLYIASWSQKYKDWYLSGWGPIKHAEIQHWFPIPEAP